MIADRTATELIDSVLELAIAVRDLGPDDTRLAAAAVLDAAGGDPIAAVCIAAALVPVDQPVDRWWQRRGAGFRQAQAAEHGRPTRERTRIRVAPDTDCPAPGFGTIRVHRNAGQKPCARCRRFYNDYRRDLRARRQGRAA